ncbi:hypothetical protein AB0O01_14120 [Streptomyces sp. NPDC093252]|uniref:hypothetical protein n=1 Tax=Streptomyces sp. NPDC093252 TaxID=3154980 RepID=UPI00341A4DA0
MSTERPDHPENPDHAEHPVPEKPEKGEGGEGSAAPESGTAPEPDTPPHPPESPVPPAPRPARHRSLALITSVAAAVLMVGGGGLYLATSAGDPAVRDAGTGAPAGDGAGTPPPLALDGYGGPSGVAPGEPDPGGGVYRAEGTLPKGPDSAAVYRPSGDIGAADVTRLAEALGIEGTPVAEADAWRIGGQDGQGPSLSVGRQAPGAWSFVRYTAGPDTCLSPTKCATTLPGPGATADPISAAEARELAGPVLKAVGQDDASLDTGQPVAPHRTVTAVPRVGGLPTYGWNTQLTMSAQGEVVAGSGQLGTPVEGDTYPVLSAQETLRLLNAAPGNGEVGIGGCAEPVPLEGTAPPDPVCDPATTLPGKGAQEAVTVRDAVFGLASHTVAGRSALVPSWLFEVRAAGAADAFTVTHPAVDPAYLESPAQPSGGAAQSRDVPVEGYTAEGRELTVRFTAGVCADYAVSAEESGGEVRVTVTETPWPDKVCILIAEIRHETVQLDEPLGGRAVLGPDGEAVPLEKAGARLPE